MRRDSDGPSSGWEVLEEESYELSVAQCGTHQFFDEALSPITFSLNRNPTGWPKVQGFSDIYLAKTKLRLRGLEIIPSYRLWFRAVEATRRVHKLWVELAPPEDMGLGKSLWDDEDDIPF